MASAICYYTPLGGPTNLRNKKALPVEYSVLVVYDLSSSLTAYTSLVTKTYLDET